MHRRSAGSGLALGLLSGAAFGSSGSFATALLEAGWTPATAVTARIGLAALALTIPALIRLRGHWSVLGRGRTSILVYGVVAVAGSQFCYFQAVERLSVGVALLLEYTGAFLIVGWQWARHGRRPARLTVLGALVAAAGLVLVLDLLGDHRLDPVGVAWGLASAVACAVYFTLSATADDRVPPLVMAWAGLVIGTLALVVSGAIGVLRMTTTTSGVRLAHLSMPWFVPVIGLALVAAVLAYISGIAAARRLGARLAGFVGLSEVLFAVLFAWAALAERPGVVQLAGGLLVVGGVALVKLAESRTTPTATTMPEPSGTPLSRSGA